MNHETLNREINEQLDLLAEQDRDWKAAWIAHEICKRHEDGLAASGDAAFWLYSTHAHVRREVTRAINRRAGDKPQEDPQQLTLPGYKHLQRYYVVARDGDDIGVPIHNCTNAELEKKKAMYRAMGAACFAHADEIEDYQKNRRNEVAK